MGLNDFTIYDVICRNAQIYPDRDAFICGQDRLSFRDYKDRCDQLATGLIKGGIKKGDRLGVIANNCNEYMILYGAAAKMGAIVLPINWRLQQAEVAYILNDCSPRFLFAGQDFQQTVTGILPEVASIERCYTMGGEEPTEGFLPFKDLYLQEGAEEIFEISADMGFVIIHTAAVEGKPRGALLTQANIVAINVQMIDFNRIDSDYCHICILPLFHIAALSITMAVMHRGGKNVLLRRFEPELTLRLIEKEKGTFFASFSPIMKSLWEKHKESPCDISSLRYVGGLENPEDIEKFLQIAPNCKFLVAFGQTEAMSLTGCPMEEKPGSVGRPLILTKLALLGDDDQEVPLGTPGEICVRSPVVFQGYWGLEVETAHTFRNGWHHTGDLGRFDEQGYLYYEGRKPQKELIKPGGENVYPTEVEHAILLHESVAEVSVIGVPDPRWGEAIKAVCVLKPGKVLEAEALIEFVATKIARYKKPSYVVFVDSLPKKGDGEIDRVQVKEEHGGRK
jgi:long-chain acyl-CoA synthetase